MKRICFMLGGFSGSGGIGRVTSMLTAALAEKEEFHITALSYVDEGEPALYKVFEKVEQRFFLDSPQSMTKTILQGAEKKLCRFLQENNIDVLVACGALFFPICVRACRKIKTRCICWEHTNPATGSDYKFQNIARSYGAKRADCNVVLTERAQEFYQNHYPKCTVKHIYNPIDPQVLASAGEYSVDTKKIISVGRLCYQKYFQMAVSVATKVLPDHPDWQWDIYGEGEHRQELERLIAENGLHQQMHLLGQVNDLYDRYKQYAMMVMTSRYEGFPMSLLEGVGNGLPLVSFDINTGPSEIIRDEQNGYLIEAFNQDRMVECICRLMEDAQLREQMSREGKRLCADFSCESITEQWVGLLSELCR